MLTLTAKESALHYLHQCISACENCYSMCLREGNASHMVDCIITDRECADICTLTARLVAADSRIADKMLQLCIDICHTCEAICRKHDNEHCQECADACHACHLACESYLRVTI